MRCARQAFLRDANLIFDNAEQYNGPLHEITRMARDLKVIVKNWGDERNANLSS